MRPAAALPPALAPVRTRGAYAASQYVLQNPPWQCMPRRAAVRWAARHAATEVPDIVLTQLPTAALQERTQLQAQGDTTA